MKKYDFTPELLDALPEELAELYRGLEDTLLAEICSRLKATDELNEVTVHDIKALRAHGINLKEIEKAIRKTTGISEQKLKKLLDDVVARNQAYYTELITLADVTRPDALVDAAAIAAIYAQTKQECRNITRSMGFLVDNGRTMLPPAKAYQWCCDSALMQVQSGAISYNQAISSAVKQLADSGLKTVDYESGHRDQVDVAARRAVMTGVNALNQKYAEQSADYLETDLVEVSAHIGARNTGNGLENHESWQGGVYRWAGKPGDSKGEYKDFVSTTGYGQGAGLGGWNCRHTFYPFVEGVSEPTYSQADLDAMKGKNRKFVFDGKEYDGYTATQMQRSIERQIRKQKRLRDACKAAGLKDDETAANIKLRRLNAKYKEFSKAAGLPEQPERLKVLYGNDLPKQKTKALDNYADVTAMWRKNATPNSHIVQDLQEYAANGTTYKVDGHNVVLDYSHHEKEIAELLEKEFGGELYMVPRVNNPQGVSTPDYLFRGQGYDLKTLGRKAGADTIFQRVKKAKRQSHNFIIDISDTELDKETVNQQLNKIFWQDQTAFVDKLVIVKNGVIQQIVKRK